jgi:hypothetical protein
VADNEVQTSDIYPQPTIAEETTAIGDRTEPTVTGQEGLTTFLSYKEYDPGTKLHATDKPETENDPFILQNKVSDVF